MAFGVLLFLRLEQSWHGLRPFLLFFFFAKALQRFFSRGASDGMI